jgi:hypothetical protein
MTMCVQLSDYAANLCSQYRAGTLTEAKLARYKQVGKITQAEFDSILDVNCPCGWIEPAALTAEAPTIE